MIDVPLIEIERFAIHDGPGIRSVVFLKGCPLHCLWCANPESQSFFPEQICRDGRKVWVGRAVSSDEVMAVLERDADYYAYSGGGVTLSGGEALAHPVIASHLLNCCKDRGWHTAVETSGAVSEVSLRHVMPFADLFLYDIKHTDAEALRQATGANLQLIIRNLECVVANHKDVILRLPCIPGFNITDTHFRQVYNLALRLNISHIDLLPYHVLGIEKYHQLGRTYPYHEFKGLEPALLEPYKSMGIEMGLDVRIGI